MLFITREIMSLSLQTMNMPGIVYQLGWDQLFYMCRFSHSVIVSIEYFLGNCCAKLFAKVRFCSLLNPTVAHCLVGTENTKMHEARRELCSIDAVECIPHFSYFSPHSNPHTHTSPIMNEFRPGAGARVNLSLESHADRTKVIHSRDSSFRHLASITSSVVFGEQLGEGVALVKDTRNTFRKSRRGLL